MGSSVRTLRRSERQAVVLPARCRSRSGFLDRVLITELSEHGCRIESKALLVHPGDLVALRPEGMEVIGGAVRWTEGHTAGIEFERPLYAPVAEHLKRIHAQFSGPVTKAVAQRRFAA